MLWQFEVAALYAEFKDTKGPLPPPLNVFEQSASCFLYLRGNASATADGFKIVPSSSDRVKYNQIEARAMGKYVDEVENKQRNSSESKVHDVQQKVDSVETKLDSMRGEVEANFDEMMRKLNS